MLASASRRCQSPKLQKFFCCGSGTGEEWARQSVAVSALRYSHKFKFARKRRPQNKNTNNNNKYISTWSCKCVLWGCSAIGCCPRVVFLAGAWKSTTESSKNRSRQSRVCERQRERESKHPSVPTANYLIHSQYVYVFQLQSTTTKCTKIQNKIKRKYFV